MLKIQDFILNNKDWKNILSNKPYSLKITHKNGLYCFKYNQIASDFNNPIVCESRGLILDDKNFSVVCCPFFKFFNINEKYAAKIDWDNGFEATQKIDGSLIKLYYWNNKWNVATNSGIDAADSPLQEGLICKNFYELFSMAAKDLTYSILNKNYTYVFELVSPYNKVVIPYSEPKLYHLMTRNNLTLEEIDDNIGVEKPKKYKVNNLNDCYTLIKELEHSNIIEEGIVIRDSHNNRVKLKTFKYFSLHQTINNHSLTLDRIISIIRKNETSEFLSYFSEYSEVFLKVERNIDFIYKELAAAILYSREIKKETVNRKIFAERVKGYKYKNFAFMEYDNKIVDSKTYLDNLGLNDFIKTYKMFFH